MLKTRSKCDIALLKVQLAAADKDFRCSKPTNDECFYDLVIDSHKKIWRAQVKYCNHVDKNNFQLRLDNKKSKRIFYSKSLIDIVLVYLSSKDVVLKYDQKLFHKKRRITINVNDPKSEWHYLKFLW